MNKNTFHNTKAWKSKRKVILARDKHMCRNCKRFGKRRDANLVHHVTPIDMDYALRLHSGNLISLCNDCHEKMHNRMTGELTEIGLMWKARCDRKINIPPLKHRKNRWGTTARGELVPIEQLNKKCFWR